MNKQRPYIVIIDDNKINNFICTEIIKEYSSEIKVETFSDSTKGLDEILKSKSAISLLLLDLSMPVCDGWEILQKMEDIGLNIPTIILTSSINIEDQAQTKRFSFVVDYIVKPALYDVLSGIFKKYLK